MRNYFKRIIAAMLLAMMVSTAVLPVVALAAKSQTQYVYIAPYSGKKYHSRKNCRGLRKARSLRRITLKQAKKLGYTSCKICH